MQSEKSFKIPIVIQVMHYWEQHLDTATSMEFKTGNS